MQSFHLTWSQAGPRERPRAGRPGNFDVICSRCYPPAGVPHKRLHRRRERQTRGFTLMSEPSTTFSLRWSSFLRGIELTRTSKEKSISKLATCSRLDWRRSGKSCEVDEISLKILKMWGKLVPARLTQGSTNAWKASVCGSTSSN
jgi:hypothetical protein